MRVKILGQLPTLGRDWAERRKDSKNLGKQNNEAKNLIVQEQNTIFSRRKANFRNFQNAARLQARLNRLHDGNQLLLHFLLTFLAKKTCCEL